MKQRLFSLPGALVSSVLLLAWLFTAPGSAIEITRAEVGIDGTYKLGKWTPVSTTLVAEAATTGRLEIVATDGEGVGCTWVIDELSLDAGETVVRREIRLASDRNLKVRFVSTSGDFSEVAVSIDREPVTAWQQWVLTVGSDIEIDEALRSVRRPNSEALRATHVQNCENLPSRWLGYDGVDVIVLTTGDTPLVNRCSTDQFQALIDWVAKGGRLVICAAANAEALLGQGGPLAPLAPGPLKEVMRQQQTSGIETYTDTSQRLDTLMQDAAGRIEGLPMAVFEVHDAIVDVEEGFGRERSAWVMRRPFGFGIVTLFTADLDVSPLSDWPPRNRLVAKLVESALPGTFHEMEETQRGQLTHVGYRDLTGQLRAAMEQFSGVRLIPFSLIAGLAVVYILLIGPIDYFLLRRFTRRMNLTWFTFPLIVIGTCIVAAALANRWKGSDVRVNEVHLVDIDARDGAYRGTTWTHVYTPRTQELSISLMPRPERLLGDANGELTALAWQGLPGSGFGGMSGGSRHGAFMRPYQAYFEDQSGSSAIGLRKVSMPKWSSRSYSGLSSGQSDSAPDCGALALNREGLLTGTVKNPLRTSLRDAAVCFGRWYYAVGTLKPGESFSLSLATPKDLRTHLTKRTVVSSKSNARDGSRELASPWDAQSTEIAPILQMLMFHEAAGGRSGYTELLHRFEGNLDMSDLLKLRVVLYGKVSNGICDVALDGSPHTDDKGQRLAYCRLVIPVGTEAVE